MTQSASGRAHPTGPDVSSGAGSATRAVASRRRPRFLALHQLSFPPGAVASIAHRASGLLLALVTPLAAYAFTCSLAGPEDYAAVVGWARTLPVRIAFAVLVAALAYHLLAGVRHLLMDAGIGASLRAGRASAWSVLAAGLAILAAALWAALR